MHAISILAKVDINYLNHNFSRVSDFTDRLTVSAQYHIPNLNGHTSSGILLVCFSPSPLSHFKNTGEIIYPPTFFVLVLESRAAAM